MSGRTKLTLGTIFGFLGIAIASIGGLKAENNEPSQKAAPSENEGTTTPISAEKGAPAPLVSNTSGSINSDTKEQAIPAANINDADLEKRLIGVLNKNPEIIIGALKKYNQNQQRAQQEKLEASLQKHHNEISKESSAVVLGKKDADVKLVVFLDPNCPHCRPFSVALNKARESFPNIGILVRHWAILGSDSEDVVRGLWAIKQQGEDKFGAVLKAIASSEEKYTFAKLLAWVKDHKLDAKKFETDAEAQTTKDVMDETKNLALAIGLEGTPTSLLVDKKGVRLVSPTDEQSLQAVLSEASKSLKTPNMAEAATPSKNLEVAKT